MNSIRVQITDESILGRRDRLTRDAYINCVLESAGIPVKRKSAFWFVDVSHGELVVQRNSIDRHTDYIWRETR